MSPAATEQARLAHDWARTLDLLHGLWPKVEWTPTQLELWAEEFGPGAWRGNQDYVREAIKRTYADVGSRPPKMREVSAAYDAVRAEEEAPARQSLDAEDLRNQNAFPPHVGWPPLEYCEMALSLTEPELHRQRRDRLQDFGITTPEALRGVFGANDPWGRSYLEIPTHALRLLEARNGTP
jgi:hypothetical protein